MGVTVAAQHNISAYNILDFAGSLIPDGNTDFTNAIAAANSLASGAGGKLVFPPGIYLTGKQTLYSNVHWEGAGVEATILMLKNGTNDDMFVGYFTGYTNGQHGYAGSTKLLDIAAPNATGNPGGLHSFSFRNMTIDGNRGNQSGSSYVMRWYGYDWFFSDCHIRNGLSGGVQCDWNGGSSQFTQGVAPGSMTEGRLHNVKVHNNGGIGFQIGGPHDSQWNNVISFFNDSHAFHIGPNAAGVQSSNCHAFGCKNGVNAVGFLVEPGFCLFTGCESEGSDTAQVVFLSSTNAWVGGHAYMTLTNAFTAVAFQLGQVASKSLATAQTASPLTLASQPSTAAPVCYLQFVISGASAGGTITINGTGLNGSTPSETLNPSGNGTYQTTNWYQTITSITVTGLTGFSVNVNALPVPYNGSTFQSGGLATAAIAAGCTIQSNISRCEGPSGALLFANDAGNNTIIVYPFLTAGQYYNGTPNPLTQLMIFPTNSLTSDGTPQKGGIIQHSALSTTAFQVTDRSNPVFSVNTFNKNVALQNGTTLKAFSDVGITETFRINNDANGTIAWHANDSFANIQWRATGVLKASGAWCTGVSSSAAVIANTNTITTNSIGCARVAPTSNVTGIVMQAGQINGQECVVFNESAFTITFASSSSNVADANTSPIPANCARTFKWNGGTNLWYRTA